MAGEGLIYGFDSEAALVRALADRLGMAQGRALLGEFADGERQVQVQDDIAGRTAVLVVGTGPPVDSRLMSLALLADACRRAGAVRIVAVVPYFGYGRGDRLAVTGQPIAARLVANLLEAAGITHLVALDLHNPSIAGFFSVPVAEASAVDLLAEAAGRIVPTPTLVVSPDAGAIKRASRLAERLGVPMAVAVKQRPISGQPRVLQVLGNVARHHAVVIDDMITTASTLERVGDLLHQQGIVSLSVLATHAVMTPGAVERLRRIRVETLIVSDSLPWQPPADCPGWSRLPIGPVLAEAVARCLAAPALPVPKGQQQAA